jgi:hypothetical protein
MQLRSMAFATVVASVLVGESRADIITILTPLDCYNLKNVEDQAATDLEITLVPGTNKSQLIDTVKSNGGPNFPFTAPTPGPPSDFIDFFGGRVEDQGTMVLCFSGWLPGTQFEIEFSYDDGSKHEPMLFLLSEMANGAVVTSVPEPSSLALGLIGGVACLGYAWRRRQKLSV